MPKKFISRIELSQASEKTLKKLSQSHGMTQVAVLSRMVEWFSSEPPTIQAAVLGCYPDEIMTEVAELLLQRHAPKSGGR